jgi:ABC-type bacteriocin/lantibiotic exporter with double-glycine peptidase domain
MSAMIAGGGGPPSESLRGTENVTDSGADTKGVVFQKVASDCGLAAVAMMSLHLGRRLDLDRLEHEVTVPEAGLSMLALQQVAAAHGMSLRGVLAEPSAVGVLRTPWIAHFRGRVGHYVVVERAASDGVTIVDPALGRHTMAVAEFRLRWSGYALVFDWDGLRR